MDFLQQLQNFTKNDVQQGKWMIGIAIIVLLPIAFLLLTKKNNEQDLVDCMSHYHFGLESLRRVPGIYDLSQSHEPDVIAYATFDKIRYAVSDMRDIAVRQPVRATKAWNSSEDQGAGSLFCN